MQAGERRLGQVFANDHVNVIPLFQRPYVWDQEENWGPLWHDLMRVWHATPRHFMQRIRAQYHTSR